MFKMGDKARPNRADVPTQSASTVHVVGTVLDQVGTASRVRTCRPDT